MTTDRVAVIIPVYNRPRSVLEALASVAAQTRPPARLVVVDDGSEDQTAEAVDGWLEAHAHLPLQGQLIRQNNAGVSAARNTGAAVAADCGILAFLDSDDLWPADYLERMTGALAARPDAVAASCDHAIHELDRGCRRRMDMGFASGPVTATFFLRGYPGTPNTVVRGDAFRAVGGYDPATRYGEDYQLMLRLSQRGPWTYVPGAPVVVRLGHEAHDGEAPHMSRLHPDRWRCMAEMMERFARHEWTEGRIPARQWRRRVGRLWYRAGRRLEKLDRGAEAHACYRRTARLVPWHVKACGRAAVTWRAARRARRGVPPAGSRAPASTDCLQP